MCTLCRELPNLSLSGYWWHNFFPSIMARVMDERLDMLPVNKQVGFFSDAYCAEWTYAKSKMVRRVLAGVLAHKVALGMYDLEEAVRIAAALFVDTPSTLLGMQPKLSV
jgi:glucuronate isomerase